MAIDSLQFTDDIWFIGIECGVNPFNIEPFSGQILDGPKTNTQEIKHLIFGFVLYEPQTGYDFTDWLSNTITYIHSSNMFPKLENVYVFYSQVQIYFDKLPSYYPVYGSYMEYFLLRSDPEIMEKYAVGLNKNTKWIDSLTDDRKALWLIGDISNRVHKFPLLYKFYTEDDLDRLIYSLTPILNQQDKDNPYDPVRMEVVKGDGGWIVKIFEQVFEKDFTFEELLEIYDKLARTLPNDKFPELAKQGINSFDLATYCFPEDWNNTSLIVMPETWFRHPLESDAYCGPDNDGPRQRYYKQGITYPTTEKTWKAIVTKKPFLGISKDDLQEKTLESLGYRTFRKYTDVPQMIDAGDNLSISEHIDIAHKRIVTFLDYCKHYSPGIEQDIEYNYERHKYIVRQCWNDVYQCCPPIKNVDKIKFLRLFSIPAPTNQLLDSPQSDWIMSKPGW